jgi:hypothetical protein
MHFAKGHAQPADPSPAIGQLSKERRSLARYPKQRQIIAGRRQAGETVTVLAHDFGVSEPTIWRVLRGTGEPAADAAH